MSLPICRRCGVAGQCSSLLCPQRDNGWDEDAPGAINYYPDSAIILPTDATERKRIPIATGFLDYFPDAVIAVAELSRISNEQHNPGSPVHWDRSKSPDEADALMRHFMERGTLDTDGVRHSAKVAWRALALLQKEIEADKEKGNVDLSQDH